MSFENREFIRLLMVKATEIAEGAHEAAVIGQSNELLPGEYALQAVALQQAAERLHAYAKVAMDLAQTAARERVADAE